MLPFSGGIYEQDKYNPLTWELWQYVVNRYYAERRKADAISTIETTSEG